MALGSGLFIDILNIRIRVWIGGIPEVLLYGLGVGLAILQFRVGGNGVKSSGPSVRLVHF
jgi:hypothetical protein